MFRRAGCTVGCRQAAVAATGVGCRCWRRMRSVFIPTLIGSICCCINCSSLHREHLLKRRLQFGFVTKRRTKSERQFKRRIYAVHVGCDCSRNMLDNCLMLTSEEQATGGLNDIHVILKFTSSVYLYPLPRPLPCEWTKPWKYQGRENLIFLCGSR